MAVAIMAKTAATGTAGIVGFCIAALTACTALAADPAAPSTDPTVNWSGFYVGLSAGIHATDDHWTTEGLATGFGGGGFPIDGSTAGADLSQTMGRIGVYGGYNVPVAPSLLVGIEADIAGDLGDKKTVAGIPGAPYATTGGHSDEISSESSVDGSIRGRVGYLITPSIMLYGTGGLAFQGEKYSVSCPGGASSTTSWCGASESGSSDSALVGWTAGAGIETQIWGNWLARIDYRYSDFGTQDINFFQNTNSGVDEMSVKTRLDTHIALLGLTYKF